MLLGGVDASTCWLRYESQMDRIAVWTGPVHINVDQCELNAHLTKPVSNQFAVWTCLKLIKLVPTCTYTVHVHASLEDHLKVHVHVQYVWIPSCEISFSMPILCMYTLPVLATVHVIIIANGLCVCMRVCTCGGLAALCGLYSCVGSMMCFGCM